jgi:hypothetical protein
MLVVATFCFGWVCKERWDGTPISTLAANPSQTNRILELLTAELERRSQDLVAGRQSQPDLIGGELDKQFRLRELIQEIAVVNKISERVDQLDSDRHKALIPYWFPGSVIGASLVVSMWVISCMVAMWFGARLTQNRCRPVSD